jgi:hypothetical protein
MGDQGMTSRTTLRYPEGTKEVGTARVREDTTVGRSFAEREIRRRIGSLPNSEFDDIAAGVPVNSLAPSAKAPARPKAPAKPRASKFGNQKCESGGIKFASKGEMMRWHDLIQMQARGEIFDLELQVPFVLAPAAIVGGKKAKARTYVADFVYEKASGERVVEDFKGMRTAMYLFKKHLMKTVLGIEILEVK